MDYKALGRRVKQQRQLLSITQDELAERIGISCSFVGHIERGEKRFSIGTLVAVCNALRISPNDLLQDSLNLEILNQTVDVGQKNKALFEDIMRVIYAHDRQSPEE